MNGLPAEQFLCAGAGIRCLAACQGARSVADVRPDTRVKITKRLSDRAIVGNDEQDRPGWKRIKFLIDFKRTRIAEK
jgi:hypothetical protein